MSTRPPAGRGCHQLGEVMSASGGILPLATRWMALLELKRPQPEIWSHPAVVTKRWDAGSVVTKLLGGPHLGAGSQRGVEKSMSSAPRRNSCLASSADSGRPEASAAMTWFCTALRAAEYSSPAMPEDWPVASDEHDADSIDTHVYPPKFVHPLKARNVLGRWTGMLETWSGSTLARSRS